MSERLTQRYGKGFSVTNLRYFRLFYQVYANRTAEIRHKACDESAAQDDKKKHHKAGDVLDVLSLAIERMDQVRGFSSRLSWSHYLKCYLLIDLKAGKLTHQDIGQMHSYAQLFDDQYTTKDDNPTVGLILCAEKNSTVAKYSVLSGSKQLFAAKYLTYLPSEEALRHELERERTLIEKRVKSVAKSPQKIPSKKMRFCFPYRKKQIIF